MMVFLLKINLFLTLYSAISTNMQDHCPINTTLKNGRVKLQSRGGITAIFSCDSGFILRGSNVSHCQTDGHWSSTLPSCVLDGFNDKKCSTKIESINLTEGQFINISCPFDEKVDRSQHFWIGNGKLVQTSTYKRHAVEISVKNSGLYTCLGYNSDEVNILRAVNVSLTLPTQLNSEQCEFSFTNRTSYIEAVFGSEIFLSCETKPILTMISWYKNGRLILKETHDVFFLNISSLQSIHEGVYSCLAYQLNNPNCAIEKNITVKMLNSSSSSNDTKYACGQPAVNSVRRWRRVIDGNRAALLSAPWMGMLSKSREPPFCGCSLISDKWIITAAHCFRIKNNNVYNFMSQEKIKNTVIVKFGKYLRRQIEKGEIIRLIQNLIVHPKFILSPNDDKIINEHDIALGKLNESIIFQENVLPICLPPPGFTATIPTGTLGVVTGWGRVTVRGSVMALTLQEAFLPLINNTSCQQTSNYAITDSMICAGYAESYRPDTCTGDSGGPFIFQKSNIWFLIGVVSWGEGCSTPRKFGVYTKVESYVPWIELVTVEK
ncbi:transmembrane protease serine 11D-like [Parasteatoda tepidariorum]|uniref:transmembrane protease serine 11D-like n=1 Tax=Parasteatoda tepidariorum TaxID=114398 RepID=UPI001C722A3A|nr:plasma kallikrein-like [Parasteatoda tepidariorum]